MPLPIEFSFRVRQRAKAGSAAGKTLSSQIPSFDIDEFMRAPNAAEFVKKAYFSSVKKILRDLDEGKNSTAKCDLDSYETIIARSLSFTQEEIKDWLNSQDWSLVKDVKSPEKVLPALREQLPMLASRRNHFNKEISTRIADKVIAAVADVEDPVADFLFTTLTAPRTETNVELLIF